MPTITWDSNTEPDMKEYLVERVLEGTKASLRYLAPGQQWGTATVINATASPYTVCIAHGGVNNVAQGKTLAEAKQYRLEQIAAITAVGMKPILLTIPPYNAANAGQQSIIDDYNTWIKTLGYPVYDLYADANDGNGDFKALWASGDGVHPGTAFGQGADILGRRLADMIQMIGG